VTTPKGKSPLDRKKEGFNNTAVNSIERQILTGQYRKPGMTQQETKKAYREWQKNFRVEQSLMEKWGRSNVQENRGGPKVG